MVYLDDTEHDEIDRTASSTHSCPLCSREFRYKSRLKKHLQLVHMKVSVCCVLFNHAHIRVNHMDVQCVTIVRLKSRPYQCIFDINTQMNDHLFVRQSAVKCNLQVLVH
jgi:hypothetical protein